MTPTHSRCKVAIMNPDMVLLYESIFRCPGELLFLETILPIPHHNSGLGKKVMSVVCGKRVDLDKDRPMPQFRSHSPACRS